MSFRLTKGSLLSLKIADNMFTLSYVVENSIMQYYNILSTNGDWRKNEIITLMPLFKGYGVKSIRDLVVSKVDPCMYDFQKAPEPSLWIKPRINKNNDEFIWKGGDLIKVCPDEDYTNAPIVKSNLSLPQDKELIENHELVNMWCAMDVKERLVRFFNTGINRDDLKYEIFPGLWSDRQHLSPLTSRLPFPLR